MNIKTEFPVTWENMQRMQRKIGVKLEEEQHDLPRRARKVIARKGTLAALEMVYEYVDRYFAPASNLVACQRGCANCCHGRVWISQVEADHIAAKLGRTAPRLEAIEDGDTFAVRDASRPCTFLGPDAECTIYGIRPLVCRTHLNFERTNELCAFENADKPSPMIDRNRTIPGAMKAMAELGDAHGGGGGDIRRYFGPKLASDPAHVPLK